VTPISNIMIDPSGERTIVTFRDPELWKVHLPDTDSLLKDCDAILTESRCAAFLHRPLRRGPPRVASLSSSMSTVRCRCGRDLLTASSHLVFSSEPLQETAGVADDGEALKKIAKLTPSFLAGTRGAQGTIWLDEHGTVQQTPAFPVHTVDTLGRRRRVPWRLRPGHHGEPGSARRASVAPAAAALKCTRFGGLLPPRNVLKWTNF